MLPVTVRQPPLSGRGFSVTIGAGVGWSGGTSARSMYLVGVGLGVGLGIRLSLAVVSGFGRTLFSLRGLLATSLGFRSSAAGFVTRFVLAVSTGVLGLGFVSLTRRAAEYPLSVPMG